MYGSQADLLLEYWRNVAHPAVGRAGDLGWFTEGGLPAPLADGVVQQLAPAFARLPARQM